MGVSLQLHTSLILLLLHLESPFKGPFPEPQFSPLYSGLTLPALSESLLGPEGSTCLGWTELEILFHLSALG